MAETGLPSRKGAWVTQVFRGLASSKLDRLLAALVESETRLATAGGQDADPGRVAACRALLGQATEAVAARRWGLAAPRVYLAWDCLEQFDREIVYLLPPDELAALWRSVQTEAMEKLSGHRLAAVKEIIAAAGKDPPGPATVAAVLKHLHTKAQSLYVNIDLLRLQITTVGIFLFAFVVGLMLLSRAGAFEKLSPTLDRSLMLGTLVGLLGGVLSVAFTVARTDERARIPAVRTAFEIALIRPLVGAALALPVILLVDAGAVTIAGIQQTSLGAIACFLAGFSERWFLGFLEGLEKRDPDAKGKGR